MFLVHEKKMHRGALTRSVPRYRVPRENAGRWYFVNGRCLILLSAAG
jgi:hypothetical protein